MSSEQVCGLCGKPEVETPPDGDGDRYHYACIAELFAETGEEIPAGWKDPR